MKNKTPYTYKQWERQKLVSKANYSYNVHNLTNTTYNNSLNVRYNISPNNVFTLSIQCVIVLKSRFSALAISIKVNP